MKDARLETALRDLESTAASFGARLIKTAAIRAEYVSMIHEMSAGIRQAVESGELAAARGAELANEMRNQIMEMQRTRDFDLGRSLARRMKDRGISLEESIRKALRKLNLHDRPFASLSGEQQRQVYLEVIDAAGRSRPAVTEAIPRLRWAGRGLWIATLVIAAYNIGTAEDPWWQTGREGASLAGGLGGGFAGGAAMGAMGGLWAGPVGVAIGVLVGGTLGALLADRAYVEAAGTSNPLTREFIGRFTSFWTGTDETGLARALAFERARDLRFVQLVFQSLDAEYNTDADDVALEYVRHLRTNPQLAAAVRGHAELRAVLVRTLEQGWTSVEEANAIAFLRAQ